jgi:acyl carrier protein
VSFFDRFKSKKAEAMDQRRQALFTKIKPIIAEQLGIREDEVIPTAKFVEDLGGDSLDAVELTMALEETFGIEIPDEDVDNMKTVDDVLTYLMEATK